MFIYVGFAQPDEWVNWAQTYARHAKKFEEASGDFCLVVPFQHATPALIHQLNPRTMVLSGFARSFQDYAIESFYPIADVLDHAAHIPTLALCGSHQLLGFLYNSDLRRAKKLYDEPMRKLKPGEPITNPDYHPEYFMERGFYALKLPTDDPLFEGCGRPPLVYESHYCEVKKLPPGFRLLASTEECRIQAMRHMSRLLIGLEFHPEDYTERFADGKRILRNFFKEADAANRAGGRL